MAKLFAINIDERNISTNNEQLAYEIQNHKLQTCPLDLEGFQHSVSVAYSKESFITKDIN